MLGSKGCSDFRAEQKNIAPILYRPFDIRYTYYTGRSSGFMCRPRPEIMHHMLAGKNLAIVIGRQGQVVGSLQWNLVFIASTILDRNIFYRGGGVLHPLYLYRDHKKSSMLSHFEGPSHRPNIASVLMDNLAEAYGKDPSPEQIFYYVYAVLYAPSYREKYAQLLKSDFPRIPFTKDKEIFQVLTEMGERLAGLHLLDSPELHPSLVKFEGEGDCLVAKTKTKGFYYDPDMERMHINKGQYFGPIEKEIYQYQIGGYQVLDKWLKDRKESVLSLDEIKAYCRTATAIIKTVEIQKDIDDIYLEAEKDVIDLLLGVFL